MRTFNVYRRADISATHTQDTMNGPTDIQFEGVEFTDGTVVIRWRTAVKSSSIFKSLDELMSIHGHPEYDTLIVFSDGETINLGR